MITINDIIYEDNHIIAVNKAPGIIVHDQHDEKSLLGMVAQYIKKKYQKKGNVFVHPVHRLDQPTSGVILFAKTSKSLSRLTVMFKKRTVGKVYWAIVNEFNAEEQGKLTHYIKKNEARNVVSVHKKQVAGARIAKLSYTLISRMGKKYLLEVIPETGRPHQIRAQLAAMGSPIAGDLKYGAPKPLPDKSIALHAHKLELVHPVSKEKLELSASPPKTQIWSSFIS